MSPWHTFLASSHTLGPDPGVRERWRMGRRDYAVWVIPVDQAEVRARASEIQRALGSRIQAVPLAQLHVTLWVGGFVDGDGQRDDDLDGGLAAEIDAQIRAWSAPIALEIQGVSSFLSCPFLEVRDPGSQLQVLRERIGTIHPKEIRFTEFVPHLTLGTYTATEATLDLAQILRPFRDLPPIGLAALPRRGRVDAPSGQLTLA